MFEIHLADDLTVTSSTVSSPLVVLGKAGQGKTVFLLQLALELIKNKQRGLLYDPYGDLAADIEKNLESEEAKKSAVFLTQEEFVSSTEKIDSFVVVRGNTIEDGTAATRVVAEALLKKAYTLLGEEDWIIIDQASGMVDDELFSKYVAERDVPKTVLSDQTLMDFSSKQRDELFAVAKQWAVYKVRNIDGKFIEDHLSDPMAKDIAAMQQYHFYWLEDAKKLYTTGIFPTQPI